MEIDAFGMAITVWNGLITFFSESTLFLVIKFFLFIYVAVLLADIVMLLILRGISGNIKNALYGTTRPILSKSKAIVRFENILDRLKSTNPSQYKVAVLEADAFAEELFAGMEYTGKTMGEKLENVKDGQIETKDLLIEAHTVRNRIIHDANFTLSKEEAEKWIGNYRAFFDEMELF